MVRTLTGACSCAVLLLAALLMGLPPVRSFGSEGECGEVYEVGEGETLHTISARFGDDFILERNPHIRDSDDVFPGLVLLIVPDLARSKLEPSLSLFAHCF